MLQATNYKLQTESGYSLIELMVAVGVFAIVVAATSGTFITSLRGQQKARTVQNTADNIRYAMEVMGKEMRMGKGFSTSNAGCPASTTCRVQFYSNMPHRQPPYLGPNAQQEFFLSGNQIYFDDEVGAGPSAEAITSSNIRVNTLNFNLTGTPPADQPRITMLVDATSAGGQPALETRIVAETTISPRSLCQLAPPSC